MFLGEIVQMAGREVLAELFWCRDDVIKIIIIIII